MGPKRRKIFLCLHLCSWKVRWLPLDHFIYRVNEANRNSLSSILSFSICVVVDQFLVLFKECFVCSFIGQVYKGWSMMFWKQVLVHVHLCLSFSPCVQGFKKIWWLENLIVFFFLTLPTWLCCCVSVLEQTTLFWCVCIMYAHVFDQVNIPWSLHLNQHKKVTTESKYVIFFSMLFYIFRHGLIPVTIFCLHLYFLLLRVFECQHIFAVYYRWDFSGWQYKAG